MQLQSPTMKFWPKSCLLPGLPPKNPRRCRLLWMTSSTKIPLTTCRNYRCHRYRHRHHHRLYRSSQRTASMIRLVTLAFSARPLTGRRLRPSCRHIQRWRPHLPLLSRCHPSASTTCKASNYARLKINWPNQFRLHLWSASCPTCHPLVNYHQLALRYEFCDPCQRKHDNRILLTLIFNSISEVVSFRKNNFILKTSFKAASCRIESIHSAL